MPLRLTPRLEVTADRLRGYTPWAARLLWLYSFEHCVTVDRRARRVTVTTRRLWVWRVRRSVGFDAVARIVYRAQALPSASPWHYLLLGDPTEAESALFFISLALHGERDELALFTVWEMQPRDPDWLDRLAGMRPDPSRVGDESTGAVVALLREYLGVPVASR